MKLSPPLTLDGCTLAATLKLVNDYIFLINNNFTMIKENEKAEKLANAKYHSISIFIFLMCVGIIITA